MRIDQQFLFCHPASPLCVFLRPESLVTLENISRVNFLFHIIKALVIAVCDDGVAHFLELGKVVDHGAAKEGIAVFRVGS